MDLPPLFLPPPTNTALRNHPNSSPSSIPQQERPHNNEQRSSHWNRSAPKHPPPLYQHGGTDHHHQEIHPPRRRLSRRDSLRTQRMARHPPHPHPAAAAAAAAATSQQINHPVGARRKAHPKKPIIDGYHLFQHLGSGSYGNVWQGYDMHHKEDVAIKVMEFPLQEQGIPLGILRECTLVGTWYHPNIDSHRRIICRILRADDDTTAVSNPSPPPLLPNRPLLHDVPKNLSSGSLLPTKRGGSSFPPPPPPPPKRRKHSRDQENDDKMDDKERAPSTSPPTGLQLSIVMPKMLMSLRTLIDAMIWKRQRAISQGFVPAEPPYIKYIIREILEGVFALHKAYIVHLDLKPENILISSFGQISLCDFGLAQPRTIYDNKRPLQWLPAVSGTDIVTPAYRSPETFCRAKYTGPHVDMWSVGCIVVELLLLCKPIFLKENLFAVPPPPRGVGGAPISVDEHKIKMRDSVLMIRSMIESLGYPPQSEHLDEVINAPENIERATVVQKLENGSISKEFVDVHELYKIRHPLYENDNNIYEWSELLNRACIDHRNPDMLRPRAHPLGQMVEHHHGCYAKDFVLQMLHWDPNQRISIQEALNHDYFAIEYNPSDESYHNSYQQDFSKYVLDLHKEQRLKGHPRVGGGGGGGADGGRYSENVAAKKAHQEQQEQQQSAVGFSSTNDSGLADVIDIHEGIASSSSSNHLRNIHNGHHDRSSSSSSSHSPFIGRSDLLRSSSSTTTAMGVISSSFPKEYATHSPSMRVVMATTTTDASAGTSTPLVTPSPGNAVLVAPSSSSFSKIEDSASSEKGTPGSGYRYNFALRFN